MRVFERELVWENMSSQCLGTKACGENNPEIYLADLPELGMSPIFGHSDVGVFPKMSHTTKQKSPQEVQKVGDCK